MRGARENRDLGIGRLSWVGATVALFLIGCWLAVVTWANSDLTAGRFVLYMDERMIFDGVWNILHPTDLKAFVRAVIGNDLRYGRILWNLTALGSWLPDRLWGDTGLIIAERSVQAVLLASAAFALAWNFVRRWPLRLVLLFLLLVTPYAAYYATTPKPEALGLFLTALFLIFHKKKGYGWGLHWAFLGAAFGAKISFLPLVLVVLLAACLQSLPRAGRSLSIDEPLDSGAAFLLGLGIAEPPLLITVGISLLLYYGSRFFYPVANAAVRISSAALALAVGAYIGRHQINSWLNSTFRNTAFPTDDPSITPLTWLRDLVHSWMEGPVILNCVVIGAMGLLVVVVIWRQRLERDRYAVPYGLVLLAGGLAMVGAIFVSSHRLWGFYLMPGVALMLVGLISLTEEVLTDAAGPALFRNGQRGIGLAVPLFLCVLALFFWMPAHLQSLTSLAHRTDDPVYRTNYATYRAAMDAVASYARKARRPVSVMWDPVLFLPPASATLKIGPFWGFYTAWTGSTDLLVFGPNHVPNAEAPSSLLSSYSTFLAERAGYARYVIDKGDICRQTQCYERLVRLPNGGELLAKRFPTS